MYEFGPFRLDAAKRRLWRDDDPVPLTPKAFDTLAVLIQRAGTVVEKDELLKAVWPDTFVEEATLAQNISTLRKALGETPETPSFIATVPRRGYRFVGEVVRIEELAAGASHETLPISGSAVATRASYKVKLWAAAGVLLVVLVAIGVESRRERRPTVAPVVFTIAPPDGTRFSTSGAFMAASPDGTHIAFLASRPESRDRIWIRPMTSATARELVGTDGATQLFWSPDSRFVAFFSDGKLKTVDIVDGQARTICNISVGTQPLSGTWNANGEILFSSLRDGILRVPASGGAPIQALPNGSEDEHIGWPQFLPDQRHYLYVVSSSTRPEHAGIYVASLETKERARVTTTRSFASYAPPGFLLLVQNGTLVAQSFNVRSRSLTGTPITIADRVAFNPSTARAVFSVSQTGLLTYRMVGDTRLEWFDRVGESLGTVGSPGGYLQFSISPDSTRVAAARLDPIRGTSDIWLLDARDNTEQRLTFDPSWDILPLWSPDGSSVIFSSNRSGPWEVYRRSATGAGNDEQVVPSETSVFADDWSRDGRLLLRQWDRSEKGRFALVDIGRDPRLTTLPYRETENDGRMSPDGRWVAYSEYDAGMSIFVRPVASADTRSQISGPGAREVRWRADGRELFYLAPDLSIMSVAAESGKTFRALPPRRLFQTRAVQPSGVAGRAYDVTSDGQRFLINVPASSPPITAVVNWSALLER